MSMFFILFKLTTQTYAYTHGLSILLGSKKKGNIIAIAIVVDCDESCLVWNGVHPPPSSLSMQDPLWLSKSFVYQPLITYITLCQQLILFSLIFLFIFFF